VPASLATVAAVGCARSRTTVRVSGVRWATVRAVALTRCAWRLLLWRNDEMALDPAHDRHGRRLAQRVN
jgi:hypothetical protein